MGTLKYCLIWLKKEASVCVYVCGGGGGDLCGFFFSCLLFFSLICDMIYDFFYVNEKKTLSIPHALRPYTNLLRLDFK